jgi:hypothetical protein
MKDRPKPLTVRSWYFIIASFAGVISTYINRDTPEIVKMMELSAMSSTMHYLMIIVGSFIMLLCGILMLKAKGIGRTIYVGWSVVSLSIFTITAPVTAMMVPAIVIFILITFFLFRPKANEYFSSKITTS